MRRPGCGRGEDLPTLGVLHSWVIVTTDASADLEESTGDVITPFGVRFVSFLGLTDEMVSGSPRRSVGTHRGRYYQRS